MNHYVGLLAIGVRFRQGMSQVIHIPGDQFAFCGRNDIRIRITLTKKAPFIPQ